MQITNDTTTHQVAELMGDQADERDGRIMLGLLSRDCITDTSELSEGAWEKLLQEAASARKVEDEFSGE